MRARNIKPGIFLNEILGQADPIFTLLFEGLWCMADKLGRLEDRPLRIRAEVFPYREGLDLNGELTQLERWGFIRRYEVGELKLIQVLNFAKHQTPHHTERPSELPGITDGCPLTVGSPLDNGGNPPDSLIPDSLIQVPPKPPKGGTDRKRRGAKALLDAGEVSPDAVTFGKRMVQEWRKEDPDGRVIHAGLTQVITRMHGIAERQPRFTPEVQFQAGLRYLAEQRKSYKAPQYFLSIEPDPQTGKPPFHPYCVEVIQAQKALPPEVPLAS